jgi:hypothetical protein
VAVAEVQYRQRLRRARVGEVDQRPIRQRGRAEDARLGAHLLQRLDHLPDARARRRHGDHVGRLGPRHRDHAVNHQVLEVAEDLRLQLVADHLIDLLGIGERQRHQPQHRLAAQRGREHLRLQLLLGDQRGGRARRPVERALAGLRRKERALVHPGELRLAEAGVQLRHLHRVAPEIDAEDLMSH